MNGSASRRYEFPINGGHHPSSAYDDQRRLRGRDRRQHPAKRSDVQDGARSDTVFARTLFRSRELPFLYKKFARSFPSPSLGTRMTPSDRELCSQSTISRLENQPDVRALSRMGRTMVDLYCESFPQVSKRITLDIGDTLMVSLSNHRCGPRQSAIEPVQRPLRRIRLSTHSRVRR